MWPKNQERKSEEVAGERGNKEKGKIRKKKRRYKSSFKLQGDGWKQTDKDREGKRGT